jgi:lipopolysaccharide transport system ATP-binding protein
MATAIKVESLSKIYRLGEIGTGTISRDIERFVKTKILKQEDPFLRIGETNDRSSKGTSDIVYSLKDINFEIEQGDAVGIIGRNGAGKSTLLKILSRITSPTTGKINIKGRVASLLEVGTGFHPELTGRENIYLNGAILGMRKREIDRKLDEIIDFSGVERYIDTPVKRYSSGMYVRLAFAVAAHLESEILIVDEVLAVGDAEFQKKCLGKMGEISKGEGRTVLFVSHNFGSVKTLCTNGILLSEGKIAFHSDIDSAIDFYNTTLVSRSSFYSNNKKIENYVSKIEIFNTDGYLKNVFQLGEVINFSIEMNISKLDKNLRFNFSICDEFGNIIMLKSFYDTLKKGKNYVNIIFENKYLMPKIYYISISIDVPNEKIYEHLSQVVNFDITENRKIFNRYQDKSQGFIIPDFKLVNHD